MFIGFVIHSLVRNLLGGAITMIELNNLVVGYKNQAVATAITGRFEAGSLTAIKGANGAGKSTLLKTLSGMLTPISGEVVYLSGACHKQCSLPQRAEVDSDYPINVYEVVAMGCWPRKGIIRALSRGDKKRIAEAIELVGLTDYVHESIGILSGGQFQRMLFARMLVQDEPVMLLDEPFTGIDENTRRILLELIVALNRKGKTIIAVLHDMDIVRQYFPNLLLLGQESVLWGKTSDLLRHELEYRGDVNLLQAKQEERNRDVAYI